MQVSDAIVARLRLDFESPIGKHDNAIEKAVRQWLSDAGARPQVLVAAKTQVSDNSLSFEVPLDEVGLRRVLSLVQSPHVSPKEASSTEGAKPNALATAAYYNKVCDLLNALLYKNRDATHYSDTALWHEQFARRIAGISTTAVDPEFSSLGERREQGIDGAYGFSARRVGAPRRPGTVNSVRRYDTLCAVRVFFDRPALFPLLGELDQQP